ncbi:unnamed protein product [Bursaphelenchus xylophilus]|uniref:(pine wood nematode) hypothetical protein n=1 Tax=Bursaphelenchus xylophilus TaxID=6326 RepID=A0A7I8XEA4_BURXY|nr:unnamed protein product [Bursaphelenchus xylophilus]CAG9114129.1 unnamed protein product [Bursaphelenchus xylophilus]
MQTGMKVRLILAGIGIFCGILAGTCFWIMYGNVSATTLAYFSSVCAAFAFYTHWAYHKQWMLQWSSGKIKASIIINTILCVLALCGMIASLVIAGVKGQTIDHEGLQGENLWITAVWFWMTFKWTMMSAIYTRKYARNTDGYTVEQDF